MVKLSIFGKKRDELVDEYIVREDEDKGRKGDIEEDTNGIEVYKEVMESSMKDEDQINTEEIDENVSDYIDQEDLDYDDYKDIVDTIEENGWHSVYNTTHAITNLDSQIVFTKPAKAHCCDVALEIVCPQERIITICGLNESGLDMENFYSGPNIYHVPHFFALICTDVNGVALSQTTLISILKCTKDRETETCCQEFYGDLSPVVDGKLKRKEERYYFSETIILQGGEKLMFKINNPDTDISKIDLLMLSDIFEKDED